MMIARSLPSLALICGTLVCCGGETTPPQADTAPDSDVGTGDTPHDVEPDSATDAEPDATPSDPLARGNSAPTLGGAGDRRAPIGVSTVIELDARDPDGGPLEYFANGIPEGSRFQKATGVFVWIPEEEDLGRTAFILFGVRDEQGAEDSRLLTIEVVENADETPPVLALPSEPVVWPTGQTSVWAVPVSDPDGDQVTVRLEPGAPPGMTVDGEFLSWNAPETSAGQTLPIGLVAEDEGGSTTRGNLRITVVETPTDSLPAMTSSPGDRLSVDLIPDRGDQPREAFSCSAGAGVAELSGAAVNDCTLEWSVPASAADTTHSLAFQVDLVESEASPDLIRTLSLSISSSASCSPVTEFSDAAILLVADEIGLASYDGTFCSPETRGTLLFDMPIPEDAGRLQALLTHDNATESDLDLLVSCSDSEGSSLGLVGEELVSLEVTGGDICYVDVTSYSPITVATTFELLVLTGPANAEPTCVDDLNNVDLLFVGDLDVRMACPGAVDELTLDAAVGAVSMFCDTADLDLELWATDGASERLVDYVASDGDEELLELDRTMLEPGENPFVRVVPWTIEAEGAEFLIEATGGTP